MRNPFRAESFFISLTSVIVAHADVVPDHVSHGAGHQVRFVRVDVDVETDRFGRADRVRNGHAGRSARETLAPERNCFIIYNE